MTRRRPRGHHSKCGVGRSEEQGRKALFPSFPVYRVMEGQFALELEGFQLIARNARERAVGRPSESCDRLGGGQMAGANTAA